MLNNVKLCKNYVKIMLFDFKIFIYTNKKENMEKKITKTHLTITVDRNLSDIINEDITNKSKYIEWLIYQDMTQNSKNEKIKKIII